MKKTVSLILAMCFMLCTVNNAMAYDFFVANNGKNIYYNITSSVAPLLTVEVTYHVKNSGGNYIGAVVIPDTVTYSGNTYSVTSIGQESFHLCSGLSSVTIPNSVTAIGSYAFSRCSGLTSLTIPNSVTSIGDFVFQSCSGLTSITIPKSVIAIGEDLFPYCSRLTSINVDSDNLNYSSNDGILYNKSQTTLIQCPEGKTGSVTILNSVILIGDNAFIRCSGLTSVTIGNSVTIIGDDAFQSCSGLTSVTIPNLVTIMGASAFSDCSSLTSLTIGHSVASIGNSTFSGCSSLTGITSLAVNPPLLGNNVFNNISSIIPVYVPCGSAGAYKSAAKWSMFSSIIDTANISPNYLAMYSNNTIMGVATIVQINKCTNDTAIIEAIANAGYRFVQWNDSNTTNPRTITVTQDTTFTATFEIATGIAGFKSALPLQVYPNPATNNITVILPDNTTATFTLYDLQSKALIRQDINKKEVISVSGLASGIYFYSVITPKEQYQGKIVKQ